MMADTPPLPLKAPLRLGTRGSRLALVQAGIAARAVAETAGRPCEIVTVKTSGDRIRKPLAEFGGKGLFVKELEEALLEGTIDFAVHSLKDLPAQLPDGLGLIAVLERKSPFDTMVLPQGVATLKNAPHIGTCSVRRAAQIARSLKGASVSPLRGNVDTRLGKLDGGEFDGLLLSAAGLDRLGLADRVGQIMDGEGWMPALAQGAIGLEARLDNEIAVAALAAVDHAPSALCVTAERAFQAGLGGSCHSPIAGLAQIDGDMLRFAGEVIAPDGSDQIGTRFAMPLGADYARNKAAIAELGFEMGASLRPQAAQWL